MPAIRLLRLVDWDPVALDSAVVAISYNWCRPVLVGYAEVSSRSWRFIRMRCRSVVEWSL